MNNLLTKWHEFKGTEIYPESFGDYGKGHRLDGTSEDKVSQSPYELAGLELDIKEKIEDLLSKTDKRPIMVMDFGGMFSVSFARLAEHFKDDIKNRTLVLIVTNQTFLPNLNILEKIFEDRLRFPNNNYKKVIKKHEKTEYLWMTLCDIELLKFYIEVLKSGNINFINATAGELNRVTIPTQNSIRTPLMGNIDLVTERNVFIHIPELDEAIPDVVSTLSDNGSLMMITKEDAIERREKDGVPLVKRLKEGIQTAENIYNIKIEKSPSGVTIFSKNGHK